MNIVAFGQYNFLGPASKYPHPDTLKLIAHSPRLSLGAFTGCMRHSHFIRQIHICHHFPCLQDYLNQGRQKYIDLGRGCPGLEPLSTFFEKWIKAGLVYIYGGDIFLDFFINQQSFLPRSDESVHKNHTSVNYAVLLLSRIIICKVQIENACDRSRIQRVIPRRQQF